MGATIPDMLEYKNTGSAVMRSRLIILSFIFLVVILPPSSSSAAVYVGTNFYIGAGVAIGCVTIFFAFGVGESHYAQAEKSLERFRATMIADRNSMRFDSTSPLKDLPVQDGMLRVFTW